MDACQDLLSAMLVVRVRDDLWMVRGIVVSEHQSDKSILVVVTIAEPTRFLTNEDDGFADL